MNTTSSSTRSDDASPRAQTEPTTTQTLVRRHLGVGWWSLLVFLTLGLALEALHGFKLGVYLDVANETRRLMWTLAHAHGVLLGLVHIAFAATLHIRGEALSRGSRWASVALVASTFLMPAGFFAGGVVVHEGDPSLGVLLVPVGALALFVGVLQVALGGRGDGRD